MADSRPPDGFMDGPPDGFVASGPPDGLNKTIPPDGFDGEPKGMMARLLSPIKAALSAPQKLAEKAAEPMRDYEVFATYVLPEIYNTTPQAKAWGAAKKLENKSREGLNALADLIPDAQTRSVAANAVLNTPKTFGKVVADFAPTFISPEIVALEGAGPAFLGAVKSKPVASAAKWAWETTPEPVRKLLTYRFGQPAKYTETAESALLSKQLGSEEAANVGRALNDGLTPPQKERLGQIVRGSISTSEKELGLRLRAAYARQAIDQLEVQAKELGLLPETTLNQLSRTERQAIRENIAAINERINQLKTHGQSTREALIAKANKLKVEGAVGVTRAVESAEQSIGKVDEMIQSTKEALQGKTVSNYEAATSLMREKTDSVISKTISTVESMTEKIAGKQFANVEDLISHPDFLTLPAALRNSIINVQSKGIGQVERVMRAAQSNMEDALLAQSQSAQRLMERFANSDLRTQEKLFGRLAVAAQRAGLKVDKIYEQGLSIGNFRGLLTKIQKSSTNFPQKRRMINELTKLKTEAQKKLADSYRVSGQKYMPRLYLPDEVPGEKKLFGFMSNRIRQDRFKKRMDIPEASRKLMGEIRQPAYPVAKGLAQTVDAVENARLFKSVADNPAWSTSSDEVAAMRGYVKLPQSKGLGALSGRYVDKYIADDINHITQAKGTAQQLYEKGLSLWKYGKVVLNPATHFRNMMANSVMMDLGGIGLERQPAVLARAAKEYWRKGLAYQEAKQAGLLGSEFYGSEISKIRDELIATKPDASIFSRFMDVSKKAAGRIGDLYQAEEQLYKLAKFMDNRAKGMPVSQAVADAESWLFNYSKVPKAVDYIRRSPLGAPFFTYVSKALPRVIEAAIDNPLSVYKYYALFDAMEKVSKEKLGLKQEEINSIKRNAHGQIVILPWKDKNGKPQTLDLSYILPWGDVGEMGGFAGLPPNVIMGGPLKTLIEVGMNKSIYRDSAIWKATDTTQMKASKISDYILKAMLPSITPGVPGDRSLFRGGYSFEKLYAAAKNIPTYPFREQRDMTQTILDTVFGIKIKAADLNKLEIDAVRDASMEKIEAAATMAYVNKHPGISDENKKKAVEDFRDTQKRIIKRLMFRLGK